MSRRGVLASFLARAAREPGQRRLVLPWVAPTPVAGADPATIVPTARPVDGPPHTP